MQDIGLTLFLTALTVSAIYMASQIYRLLTANKRREWRMTRLSIRLARLHRELDPKGKVPIEHVGSLVFEDPALDEAVCEFLEGGPEIPLERLRRRMMWVIENYKEGSGV